MPNDVASLSCLSLWLWGGSAGPSLSALLGGSWSMDLPFPPLVACCSTHTAQQWRGAGLEECTGGALGAAVSQSHWLLHLCSWGCSVTCRGIFWCIYYTSIKGFKKGAQKPSLFQGRGDLHGNGTAERCSPGEGKEEGPQPEGGAVVGDSVHM